MAKFKVAQHKLVPKHTKLPESEKKLLLEKYNITIKDLPKILTKDPAIEKLNVKEGDVIKIIRDSMTVGTYIFYRRVSDA